MFLLLGSTWNDIGLIGQRRPARPQPVGGLCQDADYTIKQKDFSEASKKNNRGRRTPVLPEKSLRHANGLLAAMRNSGNSFGGVRPGWIPPLYSSIVAVTGKWSDG